MTQSVIRLCFSKEDNEMEREKVVNSALMPVDLLLGASIKGFEQAGLLHLASEQVYEALKKVLRTNFRLNNELAVEGTENVPMTGGVLLASNHQSWLDVQILGASCPRRVHFIAKSEFETWPVLRHLIRLSESVFVRRGGDDAALDSIVEALRQGWAVAIYPEGTIPGEEDIPRRAVDPRTGLLPGHTGVARLALRANVPIVPVGVSGTGRAFPPEVYPRLELLRLPAATPIRLRFGQPITMDAYRDRPHDRELFREVTDHVMRQISALVDHRTNYAPIEVPIPEPPRRRSIGVLLLHGFTSHLNTVNGLVPHLEAAGIPYEMPILRGHGTRYQDLSGVTQGDWYVDAERALIKLWNKVDRIVVVGLSMGGLVALELAIRHPDKLAGVVTVAACLKFVDPLAPLSGLMSRVIKYWPSPESFNDLSRKGPDFKNYPKFPTRTFARLYEYSQQIAERLREVHVPIRILQSKKDQITAAEAANIIYEKVSSPVREIVWYEESGHEMMQDLEAERVFADVMEFVHRFELKPSKKRPAAAGVRAQVGPIL
jgi:carboxylesterase